MPVRPHHPGGNQGQAWEREYRKPTFVTKADGPQKDTLNFLKFLKKKENVSLEGKTVLDLGAGTGRNANYLAECGAQVIAIEISKTALSLGRERARELGVAVDYRLGDIGAPYDIADQSVDLALDVTSSNSLDERGRAVYLSEVARVLKPGGYFFVRALCKDGNKNVKELLKKSPGTEHDTYVLRDVGLYERVFSKQDFINLYSRYFKILSLEKKTNYATFSGRLYKRDYWLAYLTKVI